MSSGYLAGDKADGQWWLGQIRSGIEHRNKMTHKPEWANWRKWYRSEFPVGSLPENVYFKMIRTMVPRIYYRNPSVSITPRKGQQGQLDYAMLAMLLERVDNTLIDQMKLKFSMKRAIQDSLMFSTGVIKLGYGAEYTPTPNLGGTEAPDKTSKRMRVEYHDFIRPNSPWALRVRPEDFITPAGAVDWPSSRWCAQRIIRHVDDVRDDPRFKNVKDLKSGTISNIPFEDGPGKLENMITLYEVRDKKSQQVFVIAPFNTDKVLYQEDDHLTYHGRLPYFPIQFNSDDEYFWGVSDAYIMAPHQTEINAVRKLIQRHRRISIVKFLAKKGSISADDQAKLNSEEVGAVVGIDADANLSDVKQFDAADIPPGLIKMLQEEDQIIQEILGMGANQFGEYAPGSSDRSATEANIVNQSTQIRTDERRDAVADAMQDMVEHMNHIVLQEWNDTPQIVNILGEQGAQLWVQFTTAELSGLDYDVKVDPDSAVPQTRGQRQQAGAGIYKTFTGNPLVDPQKLTRWALGEIGGPQLTDLMASGAAPQIGAPGGPGSSMQQPIPAAQLIQQLMQAKGAPGGQVQKR